MRTDQHALARAAPMTKVVREFCNRDVTTIDGGRTLREAAQVMKAKRIGSVVIAEAGAPVGILTERDFQDKVVAADVDAGATTVAEVMSTALIMVSLTDSIDDVILVMKSKRIRHVPVVEDGKLVGLLSLRDVILTRDALLEQTIREKTGSLQRALGRKRTLVRFSKHINGTLVLDELLRVIDTHLRDLLEVNRYSIFTRMRTTGALVLLGAGDIPAHPPIVIDPADYRNTVIDDAIQDRKIKEIEDFHEYQYVAAARDRGDYETAWCLCAPLLHGGEILGVLAVSDKRDAMKNFTAAEMEYVGLIADNLAAALANCLAHRELQATEERLAQHSKLASIGQLAAGVAHEINNPLEAISRYCQVLLGDAPAQARERDGLERILKETRRAARCGSPDSRLAPSAPSRTRPRPTCGRPPPLATVRTAAPAPRAFASRSISQDRFRTWCATCARSRTGSCIDWYTSKSERTRPAWCSTSSRSSHTASLSWRNDATVARWRTGAPRGRSSTFGR
jgi:CBS domain-containing protein